METDYLKEIVALKAKIAVLDRANTQHMVLETIYDKRFKSIQGQVSQLEAYNQALAERNKVLENPNGVHYESLSWRRKVIFILRKRKRPLRAQDIIQELKIMAALTQGGDTHSAHSLSVVLASAVKGGQLHLERVKGERGAYYALPEWLDEEGKLKEKMQKLLW